MTTLVRHCTRCGYIAEDKFAHSCPKCAPTDEHTPVVLKTHLSSDGPLMTPREAEEKLCSLANYFNEPVMPMSRYCGALGAWLTAIEALNAREPRGEHDKKEHRLGHGWVGFISHIRLAISKSNLLHRLLYDGEQLRKRECPEHKGKWSGLEFPESPCVHGCGLSGWLPEEDDPIHKARKHRKAELESAPILTAEQASARAKALTERGVTNAVSFIMEGLLIGRITYHLGRKRRAIYYRDPRYHYAWRALDLHYVDLGPEE